MEKEGVTKRGEKEAKSGGTACGGKFPGKVNKREV